MYSNKFTPYVGIVTVANDRQDQILRDTFSTVMPMNPTDIIEGLRAKAEMLSARANEIEEMYKKIM